MIKLPMHLADLDARVDTARRIVDETHPTTTPPATSPNPGPISREARGLAIVLLYAAYENLLTTLTRDLLEVAIRLRVGNRRLQPGFRAMAFTSSVRSIRALPEKKIYTDGLPRLLAVASSGTRPCTIDPNAFPSDGSFMKQSQIIVWCTTFGIPQPMRILHRTWNQIDGVVSNRNGIAHGRRTPEEVGREYSEFEIRKLIDDWHADWRDFLVEVGNLAASRDFFRIP